MFSAAFPTLGAVAAERLVMPFDCGTEGAEVRLVPGPEQSYRIVGDRTEQTVTTCPNAYAAGCRTLMVHKFSLACGGMEVPWVKVASAIRGAGANRAWMEGGRLNVVMPARVAQIPESCLTPRSDAPLERRVVLSGSCLPWSKTSFDHLVMPEGYAPVGELGARLMIGAVADEAAAGPEADAAFSLEPTVRLAGLDGEFSLAKADPGATLQPNARGGYATVLEPGLEDDWITVVYAGADGAPASQVEEPASRALALLLAIGSAATIALLLALRYAPLSPMHGFWSTRRATFDMRMLSGDANLDNAAAAVDALLRQTETAAATLQAAGPLREVLQGELHQVRERLSTLQRSITRNEIAADKAALQFRMLVRELERIRRIVDSAVASLTRTREATRLPRTASEAYEVLGVNAEVSAGVLKKIVDALRMSWHPDHARDDSDRQLREDRIRQINIAWELINGKREAA